MKIKYFTEPSAKIEYAQRIKDFVPRKGDLVRFKGVCYAVISVIWIEDEQPERVDILLRNFKEKDKK